jgi:hypothetical protein
MDRTAVDVPADTKESRIARWLAALLLGGVGFAFSWFRWEIPLFFNVDFLFGSFFVMLAYLFCGAPHAVVAAVIAYSGTFALYHHPWAFVVLTGEALFASVVFLAATTFRRAPRASGSICGRSSAKRRKWRRSARLPAGSPTTSTTS